MHNSLSIEKYLLYACLFMIDDFNDKYKQIPMRSPILEDVADSFSEADLVFRLGSPFGNGARFSTQTARGKDKGFNDIVIKSKGFGVEVKFLKRYKSNKGKTSSNKISWKQIKEDFDWLQEKIQKNNKGNFAFVIGWFNSTDRFSQQIQLGERKGVLQEISKEKEPYFPFLKFDTKSRSTLSVEYDYAQAFEPLKLSIKTTGRDEITCIFVGASEDKFHFAIYY